MPSQTKENYLKALYFLSREGEKISLTELSREMGVSTPTANSMVKKLQEKGWVVYQKYKPLDLTDSGRRTAALIIRKHRLAEMYLVEEMGFGWEEVHDIAEQIEHIDSELLFDRMDELLGYPSVDPHGSPIPDKEGRVEVPGHYKLSEAEVGSRVRLAALSDSSTDFLLFLNTKKLELGTEIEILHIEPFDQSLTVAYKGFSSTMLSHAVCELLLVEEVND